MNRLARFLVRLYPAGWRKRYGDEFEAMLEQVPAGWRTNFDLFAGAVKMQFSTPSFAGLALVLSIAGLFAGLGISYLAPSRYTSTALLEYADKSGRAGPTDTRQALVPRYLSDTGNALSRSSLVGLIRRPDLDLYPKEVKTIPLEDVIEDMRHDLHVELASPGGETVPFRISFTYTDPRRAQALNRALVRWFIDNNFKSPLTEDGQLSMELRLLEQRLAALERRAGVTVPPAGIGGPDETGRHMAGGVVVRILDPPSLPVRPVSPDRWSFMCAGFGTGLALAVLIAIFRRRFQPATPLPVSPS